MHLAIETWASINKMFMEKNKQTKKTKNKTKTQSLLNFPESVGDRPQQEEMSVYV